MDLTEVTGFNGQWEGFAVAQVCDGAPQITEVGMQPEVGVQPELHHSQAELAGYLGRVMKRVTGGDVPAGNLGFTKWSTQTTPGTTARITRGEAA